MTTIHRVYVCEPAKKADLTKILEADPYSEGSFARVGYKIKDGSSIGEDKTKSYIYIKATADFIKKADERLKDVAKPAPHDLEKRVSEKILKEEEEAEGGFGSIFGE
jgi:hypothetical protein